MTFRALYCLTRHVFVVFTFKFETQIVLELIEMHEGDLARALLAEAPPLKEFAIEYPEKRMQLEHWARRGARVDPKDMYPPGSNKEKRREELSAAVKKVSERKLNQHK